jgi:hypothetical protein
MAHICAHQLKNVPPIWVPHANWECRHCTPGPGVGNRGVIKEKRGIAIAPREYNTPTAVVYDFG